MKKIVIIICFLLTATSLEAQTITLGPITKLLYCLDDSITVPYQASGSFASNNSFFVELSDANGSFSHFTIIGNNSSMNGSISVKLGSIGSNFHVKVASIDPYAISDSNPSDIQVLSPPSPEPIPSSPFALIGDTIYITDMEPTGTLFDWTFIDTDASTHHSQDSSVALSYSHDGPKTGSLLVTNAAGCMATTNFTFYILSCNPTIPHWPDVDVIEGTTSGIGPNDYQYVWVRPGGILSLDGDIFGDNPQTIFVEPGATIEGQLQANYIFYIKDGASVNTEGNPFYLSAAVLDSGIDSVLRFNFYCPDLTFDYSQVLPSLVDNPPPSNLTILQSGDHFFANDEGLPIEIRISNILGTEVLSQRGSGALDVELSALSAGVYFAVVVSGNDRKVQRIAVMH